MPFQVSGQCIPKSWVCDSEPDCGENDESDEGPNCSYPTDICQTFEFQCDNKQCIPLDYFCDGEADCRDGSDEVECKKYCNDTEQFYCDADNKCLSHSLVCNKERDCSDGSDEAKCDVYVSWSHMTIFCREDEFECTDDTICIPSKFRCDGTQDCLDASDEANCSFSSLTCEDDERLCSDGKKCIPKNYWCDQDQDCEDGSDEQDCAVFHPTCTYPSFSCDNSTLCVPVGVLCDGLHDCQDGSDEGFRCSENICSGAENDCSDFCQNAPDGRRCHCPYGMHLSSNDTTKCIADHPCDQWGTCSQHCKAMSRRKHKCYCDPNFYLESDGFSCKSKDGTAPYIVYSTRNELRSLDLHTKVARPLITSLKSSVALDFYHTKIKVYVYWTDMSDDNIYRGTVVGNGLSSVEVVVKNGLTTSEGLAVDWIGGNLYWVESNLNQIEVSRLDGKYRRTLIGNDIKSPRAISLDPLEGLLFWTDWEEDKPRIESCDMSGSPEKRKVIYKVTSYKNGAWPNGLVVDYELKRLFWIDARADSVHSARYDGSDHREIVRNSEYLSHPFSITLFGAHVYWTDWRTAAVWRANKFTGSQAEIMTRMPLGSQPYDIEVVHPSRQPKMPSPDDPKLDCQKNNGNCSHLCLLSLTGVTCACPHLMKLDADNKTCIEDEHVLLISREHEIRGLGVNSSDVSHKIPPILLKGRQQQEAVELEYFSPNKEIYFVSPGNGGQLMKSHLNGSISVILDNLGPKVNNESKNGVYAISVDWITGNIYYSTSLTEILDDVSPETSDIFVISPNGEHFKSTLIRKNSGVIQSLVVVPTLGLMYWNDQSQDYENLKMSRMDGSRPEQFFQFQRSTSSNVVSLSYSSRLHRLYWINDNEKAIQSWDFMANRLTNIRQESKHADRQLALLTTSIDSLYFATSTTGSSTIYKTSLDSIVLNRNTLAEVANVTKNILSMRVYSSEDRQGGNSCSHNNGGCQHLCLPISNEDHVCQCSIGFNLVDDRKCSESQSDLVIFTSKFGLSSVAINEPMNSSLFRLEAAEAIAVYPRQSYLYYSDTDRHAIWRMNRDGTGKLKLVDDLETVGKVAVDWVSKRLVWSDSNVIESSDFDGDKRYVLISGDLEKAEALAISPSDGIMFWSDSSKTKPKIERSGMDGSNRVVIVQTDLGSQIDLAVDASNRKRIYWCDAVKETIVSSNFDGGQREHLLKKEAKKWLSRPVSIAYLDGYLYWFDMALNSGSLTRVSTHGDNPSPELLENNLASQDTVSSHQIAIYSKRIQQGTNPCSMDNGGCAEICMFNGKSAVCACAHGKLNQDARTCSDHDAFIMYSRVSRLESIHISDEHDLNPPMKPIWSEDKMRNSIGLAFDFDAKRVFYSDLQKGTINRVQFDGSDHKEVVSDVGAVEGLVFEPKSKVLYWTCNEDNTISRLRLATLRDFETPVTGHRVEKLLRLAKEDRPRGIDVDSCEGRVYFTNWNAKEPSIQRAYFSGYGLEKVITTKIRMPNAISIDAAEQKMFWGDARLDKIEMVHLKTLERVVLTKASPSHPFDIATHGQFLFYTDWVLHAVIRVNKYTGEDVVLLRKNIPRPMSLIAVANQTLECESSPCSIFNGGCEDICKVDHKSSSGVSCQCYEGRYPIDGKRCSSSKIKCQDDNEFQCGQTLNSHPICIPYNLTCNGISNCPDGSDEESRYCAIRKCKSGFFQCANNRCVSPTSKCDHKDDCGDFSDEVNCPCPDEGMFRCKRGPCIDAKERCDNKPDCADSSDEMGCPLRDCLATKIEGAFNCPNTTACILKGWLCDGSNDCWDNWDESNCTTTTSKPESPQFPGGFCPPDSTFRCDNGKCIALGWRCDRENDCHDEIMTGSGVPSDEAGCSYSCTEDQFKCLSGDCIPASWKCDGTPDCNDGSDEASNCPREVCLEDKEFRYVANQIDYKNKYQPAYSDTFSNIFYRCTNSGRCIPRTWVCDGDNDCGDELPGLDESPEQCKGQGSCQEGEFRCLNNRCISRHFYCDFDNDCGDSSDEPDTCDYHFCPKDYYRCDSTSGCVPYANLCNGHSDCLDGSDENVTICDALKRRKNLAIQKNHCQSKDQFGCSNGACAPFEAVCDGSDDCGDYSDESSCNINECAHPYMCAHVCKDKPIGYECQCHQGFRVKADDPSMCEDIDECKENKPCSQMCLNTPGSYHCACARGYVAIDDMAKRCKANSTEGMKLIFTSRYYIKLANGLGITETLVKNQTNAVAIDYDLLSDCVFWSDVTSKGSSLSKSCGSNKSVEHQLATLQNPDGLAIDWVGRNIYWCDKGSDTIEVSNLNGEYRKILVRDGLMEPRAIAVDPQSGYMFWSDWGERPHIGRALMDGTEAKIIIDTDLGWPNALAIDYATREVFFGDAREDYIAVADMDGNNVRVIISRGLNPNANIQHIFALTVFEDYIYWSDWETSTIERCHKYSGKENKTIVTTIHRPMDVQVYHPLRQPMPMSNPCENNGGCDALCLLRPGRAVGHPERVCGCPENFVLEDNGLGCRSNCSSSHFQCATTLKCIPFWWKCDGQDDCGDGSDEPSNCLPFTCRQGQFQCDNSHCIFPMQICDHNDNCGDGSDERNCDEYPCYGNQFKCTGNGTVSGYCIPPDRHCNGHVDCPNGEDEVDCPPKMCPVNHYKCHNQKCIPSVWVCDGDNDCGDNTGNP